MAFKLANRAYVLTATTGTGSIALGSAVAGYQSFSAAGIADGDTVRYTIEDGTNWEIGTGTLSNSVGTMSRSVIDSSGGGSALTLSGSAQVFLTSTSVDMQTGVNITGGSITGMSSPTANSDVTTKLYVDSIAAAGIAYHTPVRLCTTGALSAAYSNGTSGVGATLTNNSTQAALTIDGVLTQTNDRILVDQQSNSAHNGIYTVTTVGSGAANWVLTRATDADSYENTGSTGLGQGSAVFVSAGSANAGELHVCNVVGVITFGTTNITFVLVADNSFYTAGAGITLTGNQFSIDTATSNAITANTAKVTNATHTGEVTGSGALTIADGVVDEANLKVSNAPTNGYFLSAQSGNTGGLTWAEVTFPPALELYAENPSNPTAPSATGTNAVAIGDSAVASNSNSLSIGGFSDATGSSSMAVGRLAQATGYSSNAFGLQANASGSYATALGRGSGAASISAGSGSTSIGGSYASGTDSLAAAIGTSSASYGATGANSVAIGSQAKASNSYGVALGLASLSSGVGAYSLGYNSVASGNYSTVFGFFGQALEERKVAISGGGFAARGDAQSGIFVLRSDTTNATAEALTTNNSTAATTNQIIIPNNSAYSFSGTIIAREQASAGSDYASWEIKGALLRDANAASTVLGNGIQNKMYATSGASAWAIALTADTTNGGLKIEVTGAASTNIRWVATVNTSEVTY
tara:strand:+ start:3896 stop:5986 length:2091 start_codon:yes stop_codon:yes gene_type:complete